MPLVPGYEFLGDKVVPWLREGREVKMLDGRTGFITEIATDRATAIIDINGEESLEQVTDIQPTYAE